MFVRYVHIHKKRLFQYVRNKRKTKEDEGLLQGEKNELIVGDGRRQNAIIHILHVLYLEGN